MIWIAVGLLVLAVVAYLGRAFASADPAVIARRARLGGGAAVGLVGLLLTLRGLGLIGAPLIGVGAMMMQQAGRAARRNRARRSSVHSASVRMSLDHSTGAMDGEVLRGPHAGSWLSALDRTAIEELLGWAQSDDPDGAALLTAYLERRFGAGNQSGAGGARPGGRGEMTVEEAYEVLGLSPGADADAITAAHRRLMKTAHPDRGGTDWLAARINRAKDLLLGRD